MRHQYIEEITQKVKDSYSQFAKEFDQTRQTQWPEFEHFLSYVKKGAKVLDLGCGSGRLYKLLQQKEVDYLGIDHNSHLLELAKKNSPEANFQLNDLMDLKLEKKAFDNVFCIAAFHHIPTKKMRKKVLADINESLKPGGTLILTTWNLFQPKYLGSLLKSIGRSILTLGLKHAWNDFWIKWGNYPIKRYYHSFLPGELKSLFDEKMWNIKEFYFTKKGKRVKWRRSFNLMMVVEKK